jgi:hypothetical protein
MEKFSEISPVREKKTNMNIANMEEGSLLSHRAAFNSRQRVRLMHSVRCSQYKTYNYIKYMKI